MGAAFLHLGRDDVDPGQGVGDEVRLAVGRAAGAGHGGSAAQRDHGDVGVTQSG